jgi:CheY-like chemotaxis protein
VLVVEDNAVNRMVAGAMLKRLGLQADMADNGAEALQALTVADYDLVLMDCRMPVMDGMEATRALRARESGERRLPVIALTASAIAGERERCLAAGMDDYLAKPVRLEELAAALRRWLPPG